MADLIKAARTRIKKKQEETPSQVDLIEQARINNAYSGGVIRPANISVPEMTVAPSGTYTPTIKPMYANANKIKPAQTPQTYKIKPVTPGSPLYSGYPFVRDYTGTAANALDSFHEQNARTALQKNMDAETSLYGAGLAYASGDYDTADELASQAQKKVLEENREVQDSWEKRVLTEVPKTEPVLMNGVWMDMPSLSAQKANEQIRTDLEKNNTIREKNSAINQQAAKIKVASNEVKHEIDVANYLSRSDFAEKSAAGAATINPTVQEAFSAMNVDIPNPAQFVADNRDALEQLPVYVLNNTRNGLNLFNNYMMLTDRKSVV